MDFIFKTEASEPNFCTILQIPQNCCPAGTFRK